MNSSKLRMGLTILQTSTNLSASCIINQTTKCASALTMKRNYFVNFILEKSRLVPPPLMVAKKVDDFSFQSFSFLETFKERQALKAKIQEYLGCDARNAVSVLRHAQEHSLLDDPEIFFEKLECLRKSEFHAKMLLDNSWIFQLSLGELEKRLKYLQHDSFKEMKEISLIKLSGSELEDFVQKLRSDKEYSMENRIEFFCREFSLSVPEVCELLVNRSFLRKKPFEDLISIYSLLLDGQSSNCQVPKNNPFNSSNDIYKNTLKCCGLSPKEIRTDFWVFRFSKTTIAQRINLATSYKLDHFKCWMIRCSLSVLRRSAEKWNRQKLALEVCSSRTAFLMDKLKLNVDEVEMIYLKYPSVKKTSEAKLKLMIDFLLAENFTPDMIHRLPGVVCHSLSTLQARIEELRKYKYPITSLAPICRSRKEYNKFIKYLQTKKEDDKLSGKESDQAPSVMA